MVKKSIISILVFGMIVCWGSAVTAQRFHKKDGMIYLVDQRGESWDITQAVSLGFKPESFQFGIGRDAIKPVDDTSLSDDREFIFGSPRIIGIEKQDESHAYVISKLARHEIANTTIGDESVAVGY